MTNYTINKLFNIYKLWAAKFNLNINLISDSILTDDAVNLLKHLITYLSPHQKQILKNIIMYCKINGMIQKNPDNKLNLLLPIYIKYKEQKLSKIYLFLILNIDLDTLEKLKLEYIKLNPNAKINKYNTLSEENKKAYNRRKREIRMKNMGYSNYKKYCTHMYKRWYSKLSIEKKLELKKKRKQRWLSLPDEIKEMYKANKKLKLTVNNSEISKTELYKTQWLKKKEKFNQLSLDIQLNLKEKLRIKKNIYYNNIPIEKKKLLNKFRTLKRQLNKSKISLEEHDILKNDLIKNNIRFFSKYTTD